MAQSYFVEIRYFETYYFATVVQNLIRRSSDYIRSLDEFFGDAAALRLIEPFQRFTPLHQFIEWALGQLFDEDAAEVAREPRDRRGDRRKLLVEQVLDFHGRPYESAFELDPAGASSAPAIGDQVEEFFLSEDFAWALSQCVEEVFYLLFSNRAFLREFNGFAASCVNALENPSLWGGDHDDLFKKPGVLNRAHVPGWASRAVMYRDHGTCVACLRDVSGLLSLESRMHLDHIVPLSWGGMNCVTNLQVLCSECNLKKSDVHSDTSSQYQRWF